MSEQREKTAMQEAIAIFEFQTMHGEFLPKEDVITYLKKYGLPTERKQIEDGIIYAYFENPVDEVGGENEIRKFASDYYNRFGEDGIL